MGFDTGDRVKVVNYFADDPTSPNGQEGIIRGQINGFWDVVLPDFYYEGRRYTDAIPALFSDSELELVEAPVAEAA